MSQKIHLCFFNTTRFWGGGEKWHLETATYLASRGHRVLFVVHPGGELHKRLAAQKTIRVVPLAASNLSFLNPFKFYRLLNRFRSEKIQTVVFNGSSDVKVGALPAKMAGVPAIVYRRGLAVTVTNSVFNRWLYGRLVTHFLTNSRETTRALFNDLAIPDRSTRIQMIYNGIDLSRFTVLNADFARSGDTPPLIIGTAGRLEAQKGHQYLLAVASRLKASRLDFRLRIAGEGSHRHTLDDHIQRSGLTGCVELLGFVADVEKFLQNIDIFAFPSMWEGFGYAAAEAMAAGRPVVAFDVSSNREVIEDGETGFLVPSGDVDCFADKIIHLAKHPELRATMGRNGQARVRAKFDRNRQLQKVEAFLCDEVLRRKKLNP